jgi:tetratricopeptide (TPR) repeat protein
VAFDLLHANKLAAATRLLEAIGADRLSRARAERVDAIIAYRLLGNIADTPQQALAAFARTIEIDSNDVESLLGSGWITLQQDLPGEAERRFRRALPLLAGDAQPWNRFRVRLGLGSIREQHGELPDALTFYHEAVAIGEQQARSAPGDTSWRRALSIAYEKVCDAHAAQGSLAEALDAYRSALALVDRLQQFEPGRPTWQHPMPGLSIPVCQSRSAVCWLLEPIGRPPWWPMPTRLRWPSPSPNPRPDPIPATGYGKASWQRVTRRLAMSASR